MAVAPITTASSRTRRRPHLWAYLFLLPTVAIMGLFDYWPLVSTFQLSTQATDLFGRAAGFVGGDNYLDMLSDPAFAKTLVTTFVFTGASVVGKLICGLAIALPLSSKLAGSRVVRPMVLIPMAFSVAVASVVFKTMFLPKSGTIDSFLAVFGISGPAWLTDPRWAMVSIVMVDVWVTIGMVVLLLMAALDGVPLSVLEAAEMDGTPWWRRIWSIQLPIITPTLFFIVVTQSVQALREFTLINILTQGGPSGATTTLTYDLYAEAFASNANYGASAARGVVLMVIVGLFSLLQFRLERRVNY